MYKDKLKKSTVIVLGIVVMVLFVVQYLVFRDIKIKNQKASILSNELLLQSNKEDYMISTGKLMQNISSDINRVHKSIVSSSEDVEFIESLENLANENNLDIKIDSLYIDQNPKATTSPITTLRIRTNPKGGWLGTYKFLKQIESMPVKVKINSYSFMSGASNISSDAQPSINNNNWESIIDISVLKYK